MSNPRLAIHPSIAGIIGGSADIGALTKSLSWPPKTPLYQFLPGTGAGQLDTWFDDERTLASAANETLDLSGSLTDAFGGLVSLAHVKVLALYADPANTTDLTIGNASAPFAGPMSSGAATRVLKPGGLELFVHGGAGWVVTNSSADGLKIVNGSGASALYSILIGGTSV